MSLKNAHETADCPMSFRPETSMPTDDQSHTDFLVFTQQVNRIDPDLLPDFFVSVDFLKSEVEWICCIAGHVMSGPC